MKLSWPLVAFPVAMSISLVACNNDSNSKDSDSTGIALLINEVKANIPEDEHAYQYIELKGKPGTDLSQIYLVVIDGDDNDDVAGENPGYIDFSASLDTTTVGSSGLVLIKGLDQYQEVDANTTLINSQAIHTYDEDVDGEQYADGVIEHDAVSFLLIHSPKQSLDTGSDLDSNDDGTLELPVGATILDSLSWKNGGEGTVYSEVVLTQSASDPDAATRFADNETAFDATAWANGDIFEDPNADDEALPRGTLYDPNQASANLPPNAKLTPGQSNFKAAPFALLNEIVTGTTSDEGKDEMIEILANPSQDLSGLYVVAVDSETNGVVNYSRSLDGLSVGRSGLLLLKSANAYPDAASNVTRVSETQFQGVGVLDQSGHTILLAFSPDKEINVGDDLDANDDGSLDAEGDTLQILDSIGWGVGTLYTNSILNISDFGQLLMAASRYRDNRVVSTSAWNYGQLSTDSVTYDEALSHNTPVRGFITPGRINIAELAAPQLTPTLETARTTQSPPDADDPAFWLNPDDNNASLVFATQKQAGYSVYDVNGATLLDAKPENTRYNNVDVIYGFDLNGVSQDLAIFTDRQANTFAIYTISATAPFLTEVTDLEAKPLFEGDAGDDTAYGLAVYKNLENGNVYAFATQNGSWLVGQYQLQANADGKIGWTSVRTITLATDDDDKHAEGMVVDQEYGTLFIAQEEVGLYAINAEPGENPVDITLTEDDMFAEEGDHNLVEDVEGISLYYKNNGEGYLIVSSQGSSTFGVFDRETYDFIDAFSIVDDGNLVDGSQHCDGLDIINTPFGDQFPNGLLAVQDGQDTNADPSDSGTNFKWVDWGEIANSLGLDIDTTYNPRSPVSR